MRRKNVKHLPMTDVTPSLESFQKTALAEAVETDAYYESLVALETQLIEISITEKNMFYLHNTLGQLETIHDLSLSNKDKRVAVEALFITTESILKPIGLWDDFSVSLESMTDNTVNYALENIIIDAAKKIYDGIIYLIKKMWEFLSKLFNAFKNFIGLGEKRLSDSIKKMDEAIKPSKDVSIKKEITQKDINLKFKEKITKKAEQPIVTKLFNYENEHVKIDFRKHQNLYLSISSNRSSDHKDIINVVKQTRDNIRECRPEKAIDSVRHIVRLYENWFKDVKKVEDKKSNLPDEDRKGFLNAVKEDFDNYEDRISAFISMSHHLAFIVKKSNKTSIPGNIDYTIRPIHSTDEPFQRYQGKLTYIPANKVSQKHTLSTPLDSDRHQNLMDPGINVMYFIKDVYLAREIREICYVIEDTVKTAAKFENHYSDFSKFYNETMDKMLEGGSLRINNKKFSHYANDIIPFLHGLTNMMKYWIDLVKNQTQAGILMSQQVTRQVPVDF